MKDERVSPTDRLIREVVIGCHSKVWRAAAKDHRVAERFHQAVSHRDLAEYRFTRDDRVWVFSYSRVSQENVSLLATLEAAAVREVVYVSSASTIVALLTHCYEYPRVKKAAEDEALRRFSAHILSLGLVFEHLDQLPPGRNIATRQGLLNDFLLAPQWPQDGGTRRNLFETVDRPFPSAWHARIHRAYGDLQWLVRSWPCVLRPLDFVLRAFGIRWYGYIHLSNRLWNTTKS